MTRKIKDLPKFERPYEKLEIYGEESLSNSELLAVLIESGTKEETSIQLAQNILLLGNGYYENEFRFLQKISLEELKKIKGIGRVKAIRIKAAFEIAKRMSTPIKKDIFVSSSADVANIFMNELRYERCEIVKLIILNNKNKILRIKDISVGGSNYAAVEPKEILAEPIKMGASRIILIHNHPSGNPTPSHEDYEVSKRIDLCAKMFGIEFIDHIVIGDGKFCSALLKM